MGQVFTADCSHVVNVIQFKTGSLEGKKRRTWRSLISLELVFMWKMTNESVRYQRMKTNRICEDARECYDDVLNPRISDRNTCVLIFQTRA